MTSVFFLWVYVSLCLSEGMCRSLMDLISFPTPPADVGRFDFTEYAFCISPADLFLL